MVIGTCSLGYAHAPCICTCSFGTRHLLLGPLVRWVVSAVDAVRMGSVHHVDLPISEREDPREGQLVLQVSQSKSVSEEVSEEVK